MEEITVDSALQKAKARREGRARTPWELPRWVEIDGKCYGIHSDYRDILEIFSYFEDPALSDALKWKIAVALFYEQPVPDIHFGEAVTFLADFLRGGQKVSENQGPKLIDWQQDAAIIAEEVTKVAGQEIRAMPYVHWWTFLSWFHGIGEGRLSVLVRIRNKLYRGQSLEMWEKEYYQTHKSTVELKPRYSMQELEERQRLEALLGE